MFRVSCIQLKSNDNILYNLKKTEKLIIFGNYERFGYG